MCGERIGGSVEAERPGSCSGAGGRKWELSPGMNGSKGLDLGYFGDVCVCVCVYVCVSHSVVSDILQPHGLQPAPRSMEFSRQEYWSGLPFPSPWDLPDPGVEPRPPALWADSLPSWPPGKPTLDTELTWFAKAFKVGMRKWEAPCISDFSNWMKSWCLFRLGWDEHQDFCSIVWCWQD